MMNVEVPKQYMVNRIIRKSSIGRGKNFVGVKWKCLISGLQFRGGRDKVSCSVHVVNHDISDALQRAPEA
jgi:hypothetical protein